MTENKTLDDYWHEARRVIGKWGQMHWQNEDECIAFVSYWMMRADWKYDPTKGAKRSTYRVNAGRWALVSWANKLKKQADKQTTSLSAPTKISGEYVDLSETILAKENRLEDNSDEFAEYIICHKCNSVKLQDYLRKYYIQGYNCSEIAEMQGVSKQAVNEGIRRAILRLREQKVLKNFFSGDETVV